MMMERLRWLVAVLAAFVAGWVGHAVYGERTEPSPSPPSQIAQDIAPTVPASAAGAATLVTGIPPAAQPVVEAETLEPEPRPAVRPDSEDADAEMFVGMMLEQAESSPSLRTPGAAEAMERAAQQAVEQANAAWFAAFRAEAVETPWASQTELELRRVFAQSPLWGKTQVEAIECRSRHCIATLVRGITRLPRGESYVHPESAFPGFKVFSGPPTRVVEDPRVFRQQVFFIRPAVTPGG